ncbi:AraC family transcriptional regulator [Paenibacillus sp. OV219]|uniref:AraC family transcriptional regulator n=1 Tax=Paenibacillus sp. OV219 TaxID=1884377 RepID=UPI0008BB0DA9|nr:AraC family transcriptional regulator [Paenibacillus sp. OV219]SEO88633.1 AraC-type DNA-binding protein [Paenibacillus sp. OV219]
MDNLFQLPTMYSAIRIPGMEYTRKPAGWSFPSHRHPYFEFLCCVEGEIRQWVNGQLYVLTPGDMILIGSDMHHRTEIGKDCLFFDFHFDVEQSDIHSIMQSTASPLLQYVDHEPLLARIEQFLGEFGEDLHQMGRQNAAASGGKREQRQEPYLQQLERSIRTLSIHSRLLEFIGMLANRLMQMSVSLSDMQVTPSQIRLAREASCYIEEHLLDDIRVHDVAKQLNVHRTHLHHCFKNVYGVSPSMYINSSRIREAKSLLLTRDWSMEEIGLHLRFSSSAHFSRSFRSAVGMPPIRFRQRARAL